ncbi:MAG TPA: AAA family ATPase [Rhizobiaceae bacterium]|nr:AAA family ATPase [Rhizobiaceae bacterium]
MQHPAMPIDSRLSAVPAEKETGDFIDIERLLRMALRQAKVVIACALIGLALGILYLQTTPKVYTAFSQALIDEGLSNVGDEQVPSVTSAQTEAMVLSQIEILRSARLAGVVVDKLDLSNNPNFMEPPVSALAKGIGYVRWVVGGVLSLAGGSSTSQPAAQQQLDQKAIDALIASRKREIAIMVLQKNMIAQRMGRSLVIAIAYRSHDPALATAITKAYGDAYLGDQLNASFDATEQAAVWMEGRLAELRQSSQEASLAVEAYRAEHGLASSRGVLITDQQLSELTEQLITAQADTARALARYEQYNAILKGDLLGNIGAITLPVENATSQSPNQEILELKSRYLNVTRRQDGIEKNFGKDHPEAQALAKEAATLGNQISQEVTRLREGYRSEYEVALAREDALRKSLANATGQSAEANQSQVKLKELEQKASALSSLYQTFLTRYERATQQQTFPIAKARIISEAMQPAAPSEPRTILVLGFSLVLGLMMGSVFGAFNEFNERFFRTGDDVIDRLGMKFLGYLPLLGSGAERRAPPKNGESPKPESPELARRAKMRVTVTAPASMFAETLRGAKIASDVVLQGSNGRVIGVISALPGEGKSTVAANFAELIAGTGAKTLIIDADLRNPGLTRNLGVLTDAGLVDVVVNASAWRNLLKYDQQTNLAILPGVVRGHFSHTAEALSSAAMQKLIAEARSTFDYIVVDLPPLGPVVDAKAFAPFADGFLVVVEWGATPRALVANMLGSEPGISEKVLGVALNKVKLGALPKYGGFGGSEQFLDRYSDYYLEKPDRPSKVTPLRPVPKKSAAPAYQQSARR